MSILHTAGVRRFSPILFILSSTPWSLFSTQPRSLIWSEYDLLPSPSAENPLPSDSLSTALFECFRGYVVFWFHRHPKTLIWVFACLFQSHFTEHLLVAASHRRQLQSFLFHNYCDHPCRMAQLEEQLGRINQSCESRAGGNRTVKGTTLYRLPQIEVFLLCGVLHRCRHQSEPRGCEMFESGDLSGSG